MYFIFCEKLTWTGDFVSDSSRWKKIAGEEEVEKTTEEVEKT